MPEANESLSQRPLRVVLVEDNPLDAELIVATLKRAGYALSFERVDLPEDFKRQLRYGNPDLILCDHNLHGWTGSDALKILREIKDDVPFVIVTATLGDEAAVEYIKSGASDYILKHRLDRLPAVVGQVLREKTHRVEEKKLHDLLVTAKRDWELTFDAVPDPVFLLDHEWRVLRANEVATKTLGKRFQDLIGQLFYEQVQGSVEDSGWHRLASLMEGREQRMDITVSRLNKTFDTYCIPLRDATGQIARFVLTLRDVTDQQRAEAELKASEEQYRLLFESNPHPMWVFDRETLGFLAVNDAAVKHYGYTYDDFRKMTVKEIRAPEEWPKLLDDIARKHGGLDSSGEWNHRTKEGRIITVEITSHEITFLGRNGVLVLSHDVTERKRMAEALKAREEQYRSLVEGTPIGIYRTAADGKILSVNAALLRMMRFPDRETALRMSSSELYLHPEERKQWAALMARDGVIKDFEVQLRRYNGEPFWARDNAHAVLGAAGETLYFEGVLEDISERKQLEMQLQQAQKMEAVGQLAGGVAHDFNNLLTIISGRSSMVAEKLNANDPRRDSVEEVIKAADLAAALTRQLLAFSRQQVLQPRILDLNETVANIEKMLRRLIGEDVALITSLDKTLGRIKADPGQIEQVIMNLAVNARDAMPNGGEVAVETRHVNLDPDYAVTHLNIAPGAYAMLVVSDTGVGMDERTRLHAFEPFFTTKEPGKGTGLGLATVYGIVKQSGGHIWVYSEPGKGTTFKIYLPELTAEGEPLPASGALPASSAGGTETILLVEDESSLRTMVREILAARGYRVIEAENGPRALELAAAQPQPIHLLVTDVVMPGMGGRELSEQVASRHPVMKVLFISGYTDDAVIRRGALRAGSFFLQKPFSPEAIARKVREVLDTPREKAAPAEP